METGNSVTGGRVKRQTRDSHQLGITLLAFSSPKRSIRLTTRFCKGASAANLGVSQVSRGRLGRILEDIRFGGSG
jgi:hypothetical protein